MDPRPCDGEQGAAAAMTRGECLYIRILASLFPVFLSIYIYMSECTAMVRFGRIKFEYSGNSDYCPPLS